MISRNKIKYIRSLRNKKYRNEYRQYFAEGDKIIRDVLQFKPTLLKELIATGEWLSANKDGLSGLKDTIITEIDIRDYSQISALETPPGVMGLFDMVSFIPDLEAARGRLSIALDGIRDPGNMGTIIRTAAWFGIEQIFCSEDSVEYCNPKVVQSSMGAVFYLRVSYCNLGELLLKAGENGSIFVYGTFADGKRIWDERLNNSSIIVFGNESQGISDGLVQYIRERLAIPKYTESFPGYTESLNVASAVAIVCSAFRR